MKNVFYSKNAYYSARISWFRKDHNLKIFFIPVQCERASQNKITIKQQLLSDKGVGFYFRCDDSFLKEFKSVFSIAVKSNWTACFEHYLELFFVKSLIEMICKLAEDYGSNFADEILKVSALNELRSDCNFDNMHSFSVIFLQKFVI